MAGRSREFAAGSAVVGVLAFPAMAAVLSTPAVADDANRWSGFHFGLGLGLSGFHGNLWAYAEDDYESKEVSLFGEVDFFQHRFDPSFSVGFDRQTGNAVFGFTVDVGSILKQLVEGLAEDSKDPGAPPILDFFGEVGPVVTATARFGMVIGDNTLAYLVLGGGAVRYSVGGTYDAGNGPFSWEKTSFLGVWVAGAGVEAFVKPNISIGVQYRATFLPTMRAEVDNPPQFGETELSGRIHTVTLGLNYWLR